MGRLLSEKDTINYDNAMPYDEERDSTKLTKGCMASLVAYKQNMYASALNKMPTQDTSRTLKIKTV